jgi:CheY-like chemotaxis protein
VASPGSPDASLRVLLVEDNLVNQKLAVALLEQAGHSVVVAPDGQQGIDRWREGGFDAVLMDVQMPVLDGLEATRQIRLAEQGTARRVPILAMTANAMTGDRERCLASGMDDYLAKPFRRADLLESLARVRRLAQANLLNAGLAGGQAPLATDNQILPAKAVPVGDPRRHSRFNYSDLLQDVDPEIIDIIGAAFLSQYEAALADIEHAARQGDPYRLKRAAHSLNGLFRTFNAEEPARLTAVIEQAALRAVVAVGKPAPIDISGLLADLRLEGDTFCRALSQRMGSVPAHVN